MEAGAVVLKLQLCSPIPGETRGGLGSLPGRNALHLARRQPAAETLSLGRINHGNSSRARVIARNGRSETKLPSLRSKSGVSAIESETIHSSVDEAILLKKTADDLAPCLNQRSIYLVGMMGSGKSTVGRILSEALGYSFVDSDHLVELAVGGASVAQIFKQYSESFFRDNETKALQSLSTKGRLVVATGGGAVIRPVNWSYMKKGITIWLDVPLDALAKRIAAVGTGSRPLLHEESGDPYTKAYMRLIHLYQERGDAYANADVRLCLEYIAAKRGLGDVSALSPTAIATEAILGMGVFLQEGHTGNVQGR